jgi:hypothetical protein
MEGVRPAKNPANDLRITYPRNPKNHLAQYCTVKNINAQSAINPHRPKNRPDTGKRDSRLTVLLLSKRVLTNRKPISANVSKRNAERRNPDPTCSPIDRLSWICILRRSRRRSRRYFKTNFRFCRCESGKETLHASCLSRGSCPAYARSQQRNAAFPRHASSHIDGALQ